MRTIKVGRQVEGTFPVYQNEDGFRFEYYALEGTVNRHNQLHGAPELLPENEWFSVEFPGEDDTVVRWFKYADNEHVAHS